MPEFKAYLKDKRQRSQDFLYRCRSGILTAGDIQADSGFDNQPEMPIAT